MPRFYIFKSGNTVVVPDDQYLEPNEIARYESKYGPLEEVKHKDSAVHVEQEEN